MYNEIINTKDSISLLKNPSKMQNSNDLLNYDNTINILKLVPNLTLDEKILILGARSYSSLKLNDAITLLSNCQKTIAAYSANAYEMELNEVNPIPLIKSIHRIAIVLADVNLYLSLYFFYLTNKFLLNVTNKDSLNYKNGVKAEYEQHKGKMNIIEAKDHYKQMMKECIIIGKSPLVLPEPENNGEKDNGEKVYMISRKWYDSYVAFMSGNADGNIDDGKFDQEKVLNKWMSLIDPDISNTSHDCYCGEINNYPLITFKEHWEDSFVTEISTNKFLKKNLTPNDYVLLNFDNFNFLKETFGICSEMVIERNKNELHLIDVKVLLIGHVFFEKDRMNHVRFKHIQLSSKDTLSELQIKINQSLCSFFEMDQNDYCSMNNEQNDFTVTVYNAAKITKTDVFHLIVSHLDNFMESQCLFDLDPIATEEQFKEVIGDGKSKVKLMIELRRHNDISFFYNQEHLRGMSESEAFTCDNCHSNFKSVLSSTAMEIESNDKYSNFKVFHCPFCALKHYCCKQCCLNDVMHKRYHVLINNYTDSPPYNVNKLESLSIAEFLYDNSRHGLTGLVNLGNTCFMNSALQCLSNCELLTLYFLTSNHLKELNTNTKYGSGGAIAKVYYELIANLWIGKEPHMHPRDFKEIFTSFCKQFAGFSQHDSHEMLSFMLDSLHEDLNRIKTKPYITLEEQKMEANETDQEAADRWWVTHLNRENSIIVDLFHGQYKSTVTCPVCSKISITYDPFLSLGLPLDHNISSDVLLVSKDTQTIKQVSLKFIENEKCSYIKPRILNTILSNSKLPQRELIGYLCDTNKFYQRTIRNDEVLYDTFVSHPNSRLIFYEEDTNDVKNKINFTVMPIADNSKNIHKDMPHRLFFPKNFLMGKEESMMDFYKKLYDYYQNLMKLPDDYDMRFDYNGDDNMIGEEEDGKKVDRFAYLPFKLSIINNVSSAKNIPCEFCNARCNHCSFNFSPLTTMNEVKSSQEIQRHFLIYLEIKEEYYNPLGSVYSNYLDITTSAERKGVTLYDCFDGFRKEEKLEEDNMWYCSNCKEHRKATKQMDIFKLPKILVISLKRFKAGSTIFGNSKKDTLVDFPINDLCLDKYICGKNHDNYHYELFGVNQHYGGSQGGHYTALCKNRERWYEFDDETVQRCKDENRIVTKAAYILFYKLKE